MQMKSTLVISFDFELGWGVLEGNGWRKREVSGVYKNLRKVFPELLSKLKEHEISTTWAVVSNLLAASIEELDINHLPDGYKAAALSFFEKSDWESHCGTDLFELLLLDLNSLCEVASHTASHLYCEQVQAYPSHIIDDVTASVQRLESVCSGDIRSLVFPRDQANYRFDVSKEINMTMRINPDWGDSNGQVRRIYNGAQRLFGYVPQSKVILGSGGTIFQSGSLNFNAPNNRFSSIKKQVLLNSTASLCKKLEKGDGIYHVWLHPFNLAEGDFVREKFMDFLDVVGSLQQSGKLEVLTMSEVAARANPDYHLVN